MAEIKRKGERTKEQILRLAVPMIAEQGLAGCSFQKIANAAKLSQSALFHHFKNKEELFKEAFELVIEENHQRVEGLFLPSDDALTCLRKHFKANIDMLLERPEDAIILVHLYYLASTSNELAQLAKHVTEVGRMRVVKLVYQCIREQFFRESVDAEKWGRILHEHLTGGALQIISVRNKYSIEQEAQALLERIEMLCSTLKK